MKQVFLSRLFLVVFLTISYQVDYAAHAANSGMPIRGMPRIVDSSGIWSGNLVLQLYVRHVHHEQYQGLLPEATLQYADLCKCDPALIRIVLDYVQNGAHVAYQDFEKAYRQDQAEKTIVSDVGKRIQEYVARLNTSPLSLEPLPAYKQLPKSDGLQALLDHLEAGCEQFGKVYYHPFAKIAYHVWTDFEKKDDQLKKMKKQGSEEQKKAVMLQGVICAEMYEFFLNLAKIVESSKKILDHDEFDPWQQRFLAVINDARTKKYLDCFGVDYALKKLETVGFGRDDLQNYVCYQYRAEKLRWELSKYAEEKEKEFDQVQTVLQNSYQQWLVDGNLLPANKVQSLLSKHQNQCSSTWQEFEKFLGSIPRPEQVLASNQVCKLDEQEHQARLQVEQSRLQEEGSHTFESFVALLKILAAQRSDFLKSLKKVERAGFTKLKQRQQQQQEQDQQQAREQFDQQEYVQRAMYEHAECLFYRSLKQQASLVLAYDKKLQQSYADYCSVLSELKKQKKLDADESLQRQTKRIEQKAEQRRVVHRSVLKAKKRARRQQQIATFVPAPQPHDPILRRHDPYAVTVFNQTDDHQQQNYDDDRQHEDYDDGHQAAFVSDEIRQAQSALPFAYRNDPYGTNQSVVHYYQNS